MPEEETLQLALYLIAMAALTVGIVILSLRLRRTERQLRQLRSLQDPTTISHPESLPPTQPPRDDQNNADKVQPRRQ